MYLSMLGMLSILHKIAGLKMLANQQLHCDFEGLNLCSLCNRLAKRN